MGENGIRQSPFSDAWPTPDVGGTGVNGIGGGLTDPPGPQGLVNTPFDKAFVATPSGAETPASEWPAAPAFSQTDGGTHQGEVLPWDITSSRNTVDQK